MRRHDGGNSHGTLDHRLQATDADLNHGDATFDYEAYYVVIDDINKHNNIGSRECTVSWTGSVWDLDTPGGGNPLIEGPALARWGDIHTCAAIDQKDGDVLLAVQVDFDGASTYTYKYKYKYKYKYALFNMDCDRQVSSFSIPLGPGGATNMYFHDWDDDGSNG